MLEDYFYLRENVLDVDAAVVGISRLRWKELPDVTEERARRIMKTHRFDVMAISVRDEPIRSFYSTVTWGNFDEVEKREIGYEDVIPQSTPLRQVIQAFSHHERFFFFLSNEHRITGLIAVSNLNCRQARLFLFALLGELEMRLSRLVLRKLKQGAIEEKELLEIAKQEVSERYAADKEADMDRDIVEYLYLRDLSKIVQSKELYEVLGHYSKRQFKKLMGSLIELRNRIAHPPRPLVDRPECVFKLWDRIVAMERMIFQLRQLESSDS